jgi:hypothetical protein
LSERSEIQALSRDLASAGVDVSAVEILCGEQGARILDAHGRYHGLRARIVRAFQQLGYDGNTLAIYDEALGHGELVLHVPAPRPTAAASRRCSSAAMFTMWATSGQARSSSSHPEYGLSWDSAPGTASGVKLSAIRTSSSAPPCGPRWTTPSPTGSPLSTRH